MEFFRIFASILCRWKPTLNRQSYSSSVLTKRAVDFSIIFFPAGSRIAGSPLSRQAQQVASFPWSPSCRWIFSFLSLISTGELLHFPLFPLVCPFSSTGDPMSPELLFLQCTHHLQLPAQNEHSKQDFWERLGSLCFRIHCQHSIISLGVLISFCPGNCADEPQNLSVKRETENPLAKERLPEPHVPHNSNPALAELSMYKEQSNNTHSSESFLRVLLDASFLVELNAVSIIQNPWIKGEKATSYAASFI